MPKSYSNLLDPILLNETNVQANLNAPKQKGGFSQLKLQNINWFNVTVNFIIPIGFFLFLAFTLRDRYDKKRALYDEYGIFHD